MTGSRMRLGERLVRWDSPHRRRRFREPDGKLVNLFTPVTPEARAKVRPATAATTPAYPEG
ncbi:hypothetical protein FRAAL3346 [Frankia alni ACN14a]|uniref:Uncharacterized protein n=1 Tax=Frankia alni (strain DSM 45986 / CECT 9034 / ACN14a) TaxID=326424 RepID=Q0RKG8_FRAAA|nr:hypothetical protein FRAAL3346 [Frankia alni ACN14a]